MRFTQKTRLIAWKRARGCCEVCGIPLPDQGWNLHHRRNRGMGGSTDPSLGSVANALVVCGSGTTGCHGWITNNPELAYRYGYSVSYPFNPAKVRVLTARRGWVLLTSYGGYLHVDGELV